MLSLTSCELLQLGHGRSSLPIANVLPVRISVVKLGHNSVTAAELIDLTLIYVLTSTRSTVLSSGADTQDFYFWWMPEHDAAIQQNSAQSRA